MGDRHPGEAHMEHHEKPLENEHLHDGHDKDRVQTNIKGGAQEEKNTNDIKFVNNNVHISKHIIAKIQKQKKYLENMGIGMNEAFQMPPEDQIPSD